MTELAVDKKHRMLSTQKISLVKNRRNYQQPHPGMKGDVDNNVNVTSGAIKDAAKKVTFLKSLSASENVAVGSPLFAHKRWGSENDLTRVRGKMPLASARAERDWICAIKNTSESMIIDPKQSTPRERTITRTQSDHSPISPTPHSDLSMNSPSAGAQVTSGTVACAVFDPLDLQPHSHPACSVDTCNIRVPIIGYEVTEERPKYTVYKMLVENPLTHDCWLVRRRYSDFVELSSKLKSEFPQISLPLPRKNVFGDNFSGVFLTSRMQGLQEFINSIISNEHLLRLRKVREFLCLDEPPAYSDCKEKSRAIFEAQEETIAHLKYLLNAKNDIVEALQRELISAIEKNEILVTAIKHSYEKCSKCSKAFDALLHDDYSGGPIRE